MKEQDDVYCTDGSEILIVKYITPIFMMMIAIVQQQDDAYCTNGSNFLRVINDHEKDIPDFS